MGHKQHNFTEWILRFLLRHQDPNAVLGDIEEIYHHMRDKKGLFYANI